MPKRKQKHSQQPVQKSKTRNSAVKTTNELGGLKPFRRKYAFVISIALILVMAFIAFYDFFTLNNLYFFNDIGSDSINRSYPEFVHKARMLRESMMPKWSFFQAMGDSYVHRFPTELYQLVRDFFTYTGTAIWGEAYFTHGYFHQIFIFVTLFASVFFFFYLKTLKYNAVTLISGTLLFAFSGWLVLGSSWLLTSNVFRAAFLLFAFERLFLKKQWYWFPLAVAVLSSRVFDLYLFSLFLLLYASFRFFVVNTDATAKKYFNLIGRMIALGAVGLLMNMSGFVKNLQSLVFSPRVSGNATLTQALMSGEGTGVDYAKHSASLLLRFFNNDILGNGSDYLGRYNYWEAPVFYIGLITLLLIPQLFIFLNKREKIIYGSFLAFWIIVIAIPFLRHAFLLFVGDYYRVGFNFFIPFVFLFYALAALHRIIEHKRIHLPVLLISLAVLLLVLFFPYQSLPENAVNNKLRIISVAFLLIYTFLLSLLGKKGFNQTLKPVLILTLAVELTFFAHHSLNEREAVSRRNFEINKAGYADGSIKAVNYIDSVDNSAFYRIEKDYQSGNAMHGSLNDAMAQGYFGTTSYSSFNQLNYIRFQEEIGLIQKGDETATRWSTGFRGNPLLQTFGNVKYHLSKSENPAFVRFGFEPKDTIADVKILKNKYYLPFGYTYDSYIRFNDFKSLITYRITEQSLSNLYTDLTRSIPQTELNALLAKLQALTDSTFQTEVGFDVALETFAGISEQSTRQTVKKYSTVNFKNQIALLNAFVYEAGSETDTVGLKRLTPTDTAILVSPQKFNFELYEEFTSKLKKDSFQIKAFNHSHITGSIHLSDKKMLFFSIPYDEGWEISVNEEKEKLQRVNIGFSGIVLPPGSHKIELTYRPPYGRATTIISYAASAVFWLSLIFWFYRRKKGQNTKK
jgi:uncharacterized membrane protein YfhO